MRLWYLSHRRPAKAQASLRIHYARLKNEYKEDEKCHNLISRLISYNLCVTIAGKILLSIP